MMDNTLLLNLRFFMIFSMRYAFAIGERQYKCFSNVKIFEYKVEDSSEIIYIFLVTAFFENPSRNLFYFLVLVYPSFLNCNGPYLSNRNFEFVCFLCPFHQSNSFFQHSKIHCPKDQL